MGAHSRFIPGVNEQKIKNHPWGGCLFVFGLAFCGTGTLAGDSDCFCGTGTLAGDLDNGLL